MQDVPDPQIINKRDAIVNDIEVLTGAVTVTVQWEASDVARGIKPGAKVDVVGGEKSGVRFAAPVAESKGDGARHKLLLATDPAAISRLKVGDDVRVWPSKTP